MKINEYKFKLSGTANIPTPLINGNSYNLTIENAEVRAVKRIPNDDDTENEIFSVKISEMSTVNILSDQGVIPAKKKGSQSQRMRIELMRLYENQHSADYKEFEDYYNEKMSKYIQEIKEQIV